MKIQEVIDEVNNTWGEEHEEKSRKIFWDNVVQRPFFIFIGTTLIYLSTSMFAFLFLLFGKVNGFWISVSNIFFNLPYYLLDLRIGIIPSFAALLLSLYLGIGKSADAHDGISGDARRAAYQKFARMFGYITFFIFIVNFWYGLLAGCVQGTAHSFGFFDSLKLNPGWGSAVVSGDIDLSRYRDIPLWTLLLFAWFTLSAALLLTHNEKDVLIQNIVYTRRINCICQRYENTTPNIYKIARKIFDDQWCGCAVLHAKGCKNGTEDYAYGDRFTLDGGYPGFKFVIPSGLYSLNKNILFVAFSWILILVASITVLYWNFGISELCVSGIVLLVFVSVFEVLFRASNHHYLYRDVYKENLRLVDGVGKLFETAKFSYIEILGFYMRVLVFIVFLLPELYYLVTYMSDSEGKISAVDFFVFLGLLMVPVVFVYILSFALKIVIFNIFRTELRVHSGRYFASHVDGESVPSEDLNDGDYILIAYVYCLMLRINRFYLRYKDEVRKVEILSSPLNYSPIRYKYSRVVNYRSPKALRRK